MNEELDYIYSGAVDATLADAIYSILKDYDERTQDIVLADTKKRLEHKREISKIQKPWRQSSKD